MGITKFANEVFILGAEFSDFENLNSLERIEATKVIEKTLSRITSLGFNKVSLVADTSLSVEIAKLLSKEKVDVTYYNLIPEEIVDLVRQKFIDESRDDLVGITTGISFTSESINSLRKQLINQINQVVDLRSGVTFNDKLETIMRVYLLRYLGVKPTSLNLYDYDKQIPIFELGMRTTFENIKSTVSKNIDRHWRMAQETLKSSYSVGQEDEEDEEESEELNDLLSSIDDILGELRKDESRVDFEIDDQFLKQFQEEIYNNRFAESKDEEMKGLVLKEALTENISPDEKGYYLSSVQEFLDNLEKYTVEAFKEIIKPYKLYVDLYCKSTDKRHKALPYESQTNKIILSVNLRTATATAFFNGVEFKLTPFKLEGEDKIVSNVLEW